MNQNYEKLEEQLKRAQALQAASTIFSWEDVYKRQVFAGDPQAV